MPKKYLPLVKKLLLFENKKISSVEFKKQMKKCMKIYYINKKYNIY